MPLAGTPRSVSEVYANLAGRFETARSMTGAPSPAGVTPDTAGITQAQQDLKSYYVLGYYSTNNAVDGKFRKIKIDALQDTPSIDSLAAEDIEIAALA